MISNLFLEYLPPNYILIATSNSLERDAIRNSIKFSKKFIVLDNHIHVYLGFLDDITVVHLHGESGGSSDNSIGRLLNEYLLNSSIPQPKLLILFGFCWGNPKHVNLNDVILCTEIESANQIRLAQGNIIGRAINHSSSLNQLSIFESLISDNPYIKFSKLISYDSLTTCETLRELILKDHQEVFGGEMEAWAFITRRTQVPWIILKAVSDFADDNTVRSTQSEATNCALNALNLIINHLKNSDQFSDIDFTNQSLKLKNFNLGNEIKIDFTNIQINDTKEDISKYLNEEIHPLIQFRLENFTFIHKDQNCNDLFATFLLEFIQNSIFHGQSKSVSIFFNKNIIKLKDNIDFYNIKTSENDGGGKLAWSLLEEKYLNTEKINYEYKDRKYCFTFNIMQDDLNIPNECYLKPHILNNVDECDHVFIDLKSSKMYSISKMFVPHVEQLLLNQKTVYIKIDSEGHELLFSRFKDEHPSKFFILY